MNNMNNDDLIIIRSAIGKVGQKYFIMPMRDPKTGRFPECVKPVSSRGDIILTDAERNSGEIFIGENKVFTVEDGTTFDLRDPYQKAEWEAIKFCPIIAPSRFARDKNGNLLIDGQNSEGKVNARYGVAELYVEHPGYETVRKVSKRELRHNAESFIFNDSADGRLKMVKLLGKNMRNAPDADVKDYLLDIASRDPQKIINLYNGDDMSLRLLLVEARDKKVIYIKNKLYMYADNVVLGATDEAVITWMKQAKNKKILDLITRDTFPEQFEDSKNQQYSTEESTQQSEQSKINKPNKK